MRGLSLSISTSTIVNQGSLFLVASSFGVSFGFLGADSATVSFTAVLRGRLIALPNLSNNSLNEKTYFQSSFLCRDHTFSLNLSNHDRL